LHTYSFQSAYVLSEIQEIQEIQQIQEIRARFEEGELPFLTLEEGSPWIQYISRPLHTYSFQSAYVLSEIQEIQEIRARFEEGEFPFLTIEEGSPIHSSIHTGSRRRPRLREMAKTKAVWRFKVNVREGAPGHADDDEFVSQTFDTFSTCMVAYMRFDVNKYWPKLRSVSLEAINFVDEDGIDHKNTARGGMVYYKDSVKDLGVTEEEFDLICAEFSRLEGRPWKSNIIPTSDLMC
jgi:hypothetical protein